MRVEHVHTGMKTTRNRRFPNPPGVVVDNGYLWIDDIMKLSIRNVHERLNPTRAFPPPVWNMVIEG